MKTILSTIYLTFIVSYFSQGQGLNKEINRARQNPILLGKIDKSALENDNYSDWFTKNYKAYAPDTISIKKIKNDLKLYNLKLFMGTWCGDSKREVPKLYKVLDKAEFPLEQLSTVAVSNAANLYKQSPQHEEAGHNIHRVPTLIVYQNGKEINRIVEEPVESFEKDLLKIILEKNYVSHYHVVSIVNDILRSEGVIGLKREEKKLLRDFDGKVSSLYELNTYGRILYTTNRANEAIAVFELNTKLFPQEPKTYMSLANILRASGFKEQAVKVLENAIELHPESETLNENLKIIQSN